MLAGLAQLGDVSFHRLRRGAAGHLVGNGEQAVGVVNTDQFLGAHDPAPLHKPAHALGDVRTASAVENCLLVRS